MKQIIYLCLFLLPYLVFAQKQQVERITFKGLKKVDESLLRRLVKTEVASPYDSLIVATDVERFNRLPAIAKATATIAEVRNGDIEVTYDIVENFTIIPGIRISEANDGSFAFRLSVFEFNFLGQSQIVGGFYQRDVFNSYGAYWEAPFLFTNKLGLGVNYIKDVTFEPIYFDTTTLNYKKDRAGAEIYGLYEIDFHNKAELGINIFKEQYVANETEIDATFPNNLEASKVAVRGEYETNFLDIDYQYVSGFRNLFEAQYITGGEGLLNDAFIGRNTTEYFKKVGRKGNWASRLQLGFTSFNESEFAPFTIDNQFNLRGAGNDVDRGTGFIFINTEYRHTLLEKGWFVLQGNAFLDAGSLIQPRERVNQLFNDSNFESFTGVGVRFIHKRIFNAVIRLDYGINIGDTKTRGLVFGIGQYF